MQPRDPPLRPTFVMLAVLGALLLARSRGDCWLGDLLMDPEITRALALIAPGIPSLFGTFVGAVIAGTITYITARQTRLGNLEMDRQKARRDRQAERLAPFLKLVSVRLAGYNQVIVAAEIGDAEALAASARNAGPPALWEDSSAWVLSRRDPAFSRALANLMATDKAVRDAITAIYPRQGQPWPPANITGRIAALTAANDRLGDAIAELVDAIDDYLDGSAPR